MPLQSDLKKLIELFQEKCNFRVTNLAHHAEGAIYGACSFVLNDKKIELRVSKTTPRKTGQFVTVWKRNTLGLTAPLDDTDDFDFVIIIARNGDKLGQFIFPRPLLIENGIITHGSKMGKRGIRVYPPWDSAPNKQAIRTQAWQVKYFVEVKDGLHNLQLTRQLLSNGCPPG